MKVSLHTVKLLFAIFLFSVEYSSLGNLLGIKKPIEKSILKLNYKLKIFIGIPSSFEIACN